MSTQCNLEAKPNKNVPLGRQPVSMQRKNRHSVRHAMETLLPITTICESETEGYTFKWRMEKT